MGALRVAVERRELANCDMEIFEVLRFRQAMNFVENLDAFNFDLTETLVHRVHAGVVDGCVVVTGADGAIDRHRGQAVAKRIHSRSRFAFLSAGAAASGAVALVCCDLPLRRHWLTSSAPGLDQKR